MAITKVVPAVIAVTNNITSNTFGSANTIPSFQVDGSGVIVAASNTAITLTANSVANNQFQTGSIENYMRAQGAFAGNRNKIINGAMQIDQRNAGGTLTVSASSQYVVDRWLIYGTQSAKFTSAQGGPITGAAATAGFNKYLNVNSSSSYSVNSNDVFLVRQAIEGYNITDLQWGTANAKTVTLSFWVNSTLTGTFGGSLTNGDVNRSYPFSYTIVAANAWEQKFITISGPTTGTWDSTSGTGIRLYFNMGAGSTFNGTANAWATVSDVTFPTGSTSVVGTSGANWYLTGVQLEVGSTPTPFEFRHFGQELNLCLRYFESTVGLGEAAASGTINSFRATLGVYAGNSYFGPIVFKVNKRSIPTVTFYNESNTSGALTAYTTTTNASQTATTQNATTTGCNGTLSSVTGSNFVQGKWSAESEI